MMESSLLGSDSLVRQQFSRALANDELELKDKLRFNELQLERERARTNALQSELHDVKGALAMCEAEMDKQAAERRVEAEQLSALRQQIKHLNDEKQAALEQVLKDTAKWQDRCRQLELTAREQQADVAHARDASHKIAVLEKQLSTTDLRMHELDQQLQLRESEVSTMPY